MESKATKLLRVTVGLALCLASALASRAQQPSPSPQKSAAAAQTQSSAPAKAGEEAAPYQITSSVEFGVRGLRVDGDLNKFKSDLNYGAGARVFDSSLLVQAREGEGGPFDTLLVTSTGWGADRQGSMRVSAEKSRWYKFDGQFRRFKYFRFLNNITNPNYRTPACPTCRTTEAGTGQHGFDTRQSVGDFDLTLLPKNRNFRFNVGYSPFRYSGPAYTTWHYGGDDFQFLTDTRSRSNDFRVGADWRLGPVDFSFLQGFRRFRDDTEINDQSVNLGVNPTASTARTTSLTRFQPVRGEVNYTRFSAHTLLAKRLDVTGRLVYSAARTRFTESETVSGVNFNTRITNIPGAINPPNLLPFGQWNFAGGAKRPYALGDIGVTYLATDKLRISNTFRVEQFQISGSDLYNGVFSLTRTNGTGAVTLRPSGASFELTKYRKFQNTVEGDYQLSDRYSMHLGYRYGTRRHEVFTEGANLANNGAPLVAPSGEEETNHTHALLAGFRARPVKDWTVWFDTEHGTADNVFARVGNYNYTNFRARTRYRASKQLSLSLALVTRNNSNPSNVDGISLADFGVDVRSRTFTSSVDYAPLSRLSFNVAYNYQWQNSDAVIQYAYAIPPAAATNAAFTGHSLYFVRNHYFNFDVVAQPFNRVTFYAAYRVNRDTGQGDRLSEPLNSVLVTSYPMHFQSPEARVSFRVNRRVDWNVGYQYYNYNESRLAAYNLAPFYIVSARPQNYHAHLPYASVRLYFGNGDR